MADRLLRHIPTGVLYIYQPVYAARDDFEEIIDVEAKEIPTPKPRAKIKAEVPKVDEEALSADASRDLP